MKKNTIIFVVLVVFAVAALVLYNASTKKINLEALNKLTPKPTPTKSANLRDLNDHVLVEPTLGEANLPQTHELTKGGLPLDASQEDTQKNNSQPVGGFQKIKLNDNGFLPDNLVLKSGSSVIIVNESLQPMKLIELNTESKVINGSFTMTYSLGKNGVYEVRIQQTGKHYIVNEYNKNQKVTIDVEN